MFQETSEQSSLRFFILFNSFSSIILFNFLFLILILLFVCLITLLENNA